jgi:FkbM family methyltransferase
MLLGLRRPLGIIGALQYLVQIRRQHNFKDGDLYTLRSKNARYPLLARALTSDIHVFNQIFIEEEYSCLNDLEKVDSVIDCGANVGYSSSYFLTRFPSCNLVAVEPDEGNFRIAKLNLQSFGSRVSLMRAGIWSHRGSLKISETVYRDGREWSVQVEECDPLHANALPAIDIASIADDFGINRISVLKMDIEGAEAVVFGENSDCWLKKVDNIVIELHDDSCFGSATGIVTDKILRTNRFTRSTSGELTVFRSKT